MLVRIPGALFALLLPVLLAAPAGQAGAAEAPPSSLAITGGTLIDGLGGPSIPDAVVVIEAGEIRCAGRGCDPSRAAEQLDARGRFVLPGLIDTHIHLDWDAHARWSPPVVGRVMFAHGITTVRDAGADRATFARNVAAKALHEDPTVPVPRLSVAAPLTDADLPDAASADAVVDALARRGADSIKLRSLFDAERLAALSDAAHARGLPIWGHNWNYPPYTINLDHAVRAGVDGVTHLDAIAGWVQAGATDRMPQPPPAMRGNGEWKAGRHPHAHLYWQKELWSHADADRVEAVIGALLAADAWVEPLLLTDYKLQDPLRFTVLSAFSNRFGFLLPDRSGEPVEKWNPDAIQIDGFENACAFVTGLLDRGGRILAGSDVKFLPGAGLQAELELLIECGVSPHSAIAAATSQAARALHREDEIGSIAPGLRADLVLLSANPLHEIDAVQQVWRVVKGGVVYDPAHVEAAAAATYAEVVDERRTRRNAKRFAGVAALVAAAGVPVAVWHARRSRAHAIPDRRRGASAGKRRDRAGGSSSRAA